MRIQRFLFLIVSVLSLAVLLQGCANNTTPSVVTEPIALDIVAENTEGYTIVVSDRASDGVTALAVELRSTIEAATGAKLAFTDDYVEPDSAGNSREILIGLTDRDASRQALQETPYGEYSIRVMGERIVVSGWDENSLAIACVRLSEYVEDNGTAGHLTLMSDYSLTGRTFAGLSDLPLYGNLDEKLQMMDLGDNSRMLYVKGTSAEEFNAYLTKLSEAGFTEFASHEAGKNRYATFTNDQLVINASFCSVTQEARIIADKAYDMTLFTEQKYEKICEPAVHLLGLEFESPTEPGNYVLNALGLIFRLEDGRFVVVDGNYYGDKQARLLYQTLCDLAVDEDNIVIAAWIFTHAHSDHVGAFSTLSGASYKDKITIEYFLYHNTTGEQYKNAGGAGALSNMRSAMKQYPSVEHIKLQSGQVLKIGGAEIEVLSTFADMEPTTLADFNATSVVLRFTMGGNTILVPGDATNGICNALIRKYGEYLKSDMVQITHHGYNGVAEFYKTVDADVILFPVAARQFYGEGELYRIMDWDHNKAALDVAKECYVAGETGHTLILPHTPENNKTVKIYDGR